MLLAGSIFDFSAEANELTFEAISLSNGNPLSSMKNVGLVKDKSGVQLLKVIVLLNIKES